MITTDGNFTFTTPLDDQSNYAVTVFQQSALANAIVQCDVSKGTGKLTGADITNIGITCSTTYTVSVTVSGYSTGNVMVLRNNGTDDLSLSVDGLYTFSTGLADGTPYTVTIATATTELKTSCTLANNIDEINGDGATDVTVTCNDNIAPEIASTNPAGGASDVAVETIISAVFDEDMLQTSISTDAITLADSLSISTTGVINYDVLARIVSLTPASPLALLRTYTATLSATMTDLSGQSLVSIPWSFSSRDGVWGTAQLIETENLGDAQNPQISLDLAGNGIAVWYQSDGIRKNIWANRFDAAANNGVGAWGTAQLIETENLGRALAPQLSLDPAGNGIAVWRQSDGTTQFDIWANRFDATANNGVGAWGIAQLIETDNVGETLSPQISLDPAGNGIAVWWRNDGTRFNIWANRFDAAANNGVGAWGTAQLIETEDLGDARNPNISLDPTGKGITVWHQSDGTRNNILSNRFE